MEKTIKNPYKVLAENWDGNTVYKYDLGDRMGILNILTNADRQGAEDAIQMFEIKNENGQPITIEECFRRFGFVAITALNSDDKLF